MPQFELRLEKQEMFTHLDDDDVLRVFCIGEMNRFVKEHPKCTDLLYSKVPIDEGLIGHIQENMEIEEKRVRRMKKPYLVQPCLGIIWGGDRPSEEITVVDGNHRIVKLWQKGKRFANVVVFKRPFWENFLVPDHLAQEMNEEADLLTRDSGILEWEKGKTA